MSALPSGYEFTDDQSRIDPVAAHAFLTRSYWSPGITPHKVATAISGSFCVAVLHDGDQVGMARLVTDFATFAYLADVYVLEEHRGQGIGKAMIAFIQGHPRLQGLRRWLLFTQDAHGLYEQFGFENLPYPERAMLRDFPEAHLQ
jgi:GNAT superfamily N-acetyltransferase